MNFLYSKVCHICFPVLTAQFIEPCWSWFIGDREELRELLQRCPLGRCWQALLAGDGLPSTPHTFVSSIDLKEPENQTTPCLENAHPSSLLLPVVQNVKTSLLGREGHACISILSYNFIQWILIKYLLCLRYFSRSLRNISVSKKKNTCLLKVSILVIFFLA